MALITCPECPRDVSDQAASCPGCGHPLQRAAPPQKHAGPPDNCSHCGGKLKKGAEAKSEGIGCLILIIGLVLTPILIGIPIIIYGIHLMSKREGFWRCKNCGAKFAREIKWYQLG